MPADKMLDVMIVGTATREAMEKAGAIIGTMTKHVQTAMVPEDKLQTLRYVPGVQQVEMAAGLKPALTSSEVDILAYKDWFTSHSAANPYDPPWDGAATGDNVIVGIVDTGIDYTNADFFVTTSDSRILFIWDQTIIGTPPSGYTYGAEFTKAHIDASTVSVTCKDTDTHGTHIAGIACANGRKTSGIFDDYRFVGVAPESDIIVVKGTTLKYTQNFVESKIVDACNYIFGKAVTAEKPCVILLAMGHRRGAHDGTSSLDLALTALTQASAGRAIVCASGNDGLFNMHASLDLLPGGSDTITFLVPPYTQSDTLTEYMEIEGWHNSTAHFTVKLTSPNGFTTGYIAPSATSGVISTTDGDFRLDNGVVTNAPGTAYKIYIFINEVVVGHSPRTGTWTLEVQRHPTATTGRVDFWQTAAVLAGTTSPVTFTSHADNLYQTWSPATADGVISAGSYVTLITWTSGDGLPAYQPINGQVIGGMSNESNRGPRRDGAFRPDIAAPGYQIQAALSTQSNAPPNSTFRTDDNVHCVKHGTSAAAAHVAGAVALFFEGSPGQDQEAARAWLIDNAAADTFTGAVPNTIWGAGKLRVWPVVGGSPGAPILTPFLVSPTSSQKIRFTAPAGTLISTTSTIVDTTIRCYDSNGTLLNIALATDTQAYFEVYTQEHGPTTDNQYDIRGVKSTTGLEFQPVGVRFNITSNDELDADIPLL